MALAHYAHPSDRAPQTLGPRQQALLTELREAAAELSGQELRPQRTAADLPGGNRGLGLSKVLLQGFKPLFHTFEIHGLCRSCQQSEPLAHG